jgi:two-component system, OmpR family, alkaline phosphatase synthesis response regulator PhoP
MTRILLIEDNEDLAFGLRNNLEVEGYEVEVALDGSSGYRRASEEDFDLAILDLMLPGLSGFTVLSRLRAERRNLPVLVLTARGEEADKVRGLKLGADDYVTKPFGLLELLARVEAMLRRARPAAPEAHAEVQRFGDVELRVAPRVVLREGAPVALTPKELDLLLFLCRRRGRVVSRMELLRSVWGYADAAVSRTVDTHIAELRRKLEPDPASPRYIVTVRKAGYRLEAAI